MYRASFNSWIQAAALAVVVGAALSVPAGAEAQTAAALYQRAQARETEVRAAEKPALAALRSVAASYENVVRRYPRSGYADNALWQAAGLFDLAFESARQARDQAQARRLYGWLSREYPTSSLAKQAAARLTSSATAKPTAPTPPPSAASARSATASSRGAAARTAAPAAAVAPVNTGLPSQILPAPITLVGISLSPLPKGDRLIFELTEESAYTSTRNQAAGVVTVVLPNVGLSAQSITTAASLRGTVVSSVRLTPKNGGTEVEVRMTGQPRHSAFPLYGPYRLVLDIEGDATIARESAPAPVAAPRPSPAAPTASSEVIRTAALKPAAPEPANEARSSAGPISTAAPLVSKAAESAEPHATDSPSPVPAAPASVARGGYSLARQLGLGVSRIVIDPGHGGHDPGARAHGLNEADIVLDVALRLERLLLAQPGFEVVLTRRTNEFIALEERTALANREGADLFLSIHANSSPQASTRGVETYVLNFATNAQAEAVAARENAASAQSMRLLPGLVKAITLNNKRTESRELAGMVQAALIKQMRSQNRSVKDLGVKQAPFVVLIGAEMPSVLAELSFITNRADATLLKQASYRQRVAQALADAVLKYQGSLKKVTEVATTASGR
jgi:N-acetylmuramoyl-L-alanine amidase